MRTEQTTSIKSTLNGTMSLSPVSGRQIELYGEFTISDGDIGFRFMKSGNNYAELSYNTNTGAVTLDLTSLSRVSNDAGIYNGIYSTTIPGKPKTGEKAILHLFLDGSIADIFINEKWAFSVRLFSDDANQTDIEVFASSPTDVLVKAWILDADKNSTDGIQEIANESSLIGNYNVYDIAGRNLVNMSSHAIHISNGKKYYNK